MQLLVQRLIKSPFRLKLINHKFMHARWSLLFVSFGKKRHSTLWYRRAVTKSGTTTKKSPLFFLRISKLYLLNTLQAKFQAFIWRTRLFIQTAIFQFNSPPLLHQKGYNDVIHSRASECNVCVNVTGSRLFCMQNGSLEFSDSKTRVLL